MRRGFLAYTREELARIGGVGDFHADFPPLPVSESLARQYDTPEALAAGWVVTWEDAADPETRNLNPET